MQANISKLIGSKFLFRGRTWQLVEVLDDEDSLVIAPEHAKQSGRIQANQYGQATRRCRECLTLRLSNTEGDGYSESVLELLSGRLKE
ncbi:MAG: hypothetical protein ACWA5Q_11300 [bacterium]